MHSLLPVIQEWEQENWGDINLDNRIIKINKTVYAKDKVENGRWYLGTSKTIDSHREVYICDTIYSFLLKYKELQNNYIKELGKKYKHYTLEEVKKRYCGSIRS